MTSRLKRNRHLKYRKAKGWKPPTPSIAQWYKAQGLGSGSKKAYKKKKRKHLLERRRRRRAHLHARGHGKHS